MKAAGIILAAGRGSRMRNLTEERPKCMVELAGKPLLDICGKPLIQRVWEIVSRARGLDDVVVAVLPMPWSVSAAGCA